MLLWRFWKEQNKHPKGEVFHTICDVSDAESVQKLADFSKQSLGTVNYWINNAAVNGVREFESFGWRYITYS
jgi:short-subunit dehydrogenase